MKTLIENLIKKTRHAELVSASQTDPHPSCGHPLPEVEGKKCAFTLAEVLITLGIIGVVAALTIPALIDNYQKHEVPIRLKKMYNTLHNAIKLAEIENGPSANWTFSSDAEAKEFYATQILPHMNCIKIVKSRFQDMADDCYLNDGSAITGYGVRRYGLLEVYFYPSTAKKYLNNTAKGISRRYRLYYSINYGQKGETLQFMGNINKYTRDYLMNGKNNSFACKGRDPRACFYIIMLDGWKIAPDYPW